MDGSVSLNSGSIRSVWGACDCIIGVRLPLAIPLTESARERHLLCSQNGTIPGALEANSKLTVFASLTISLTIRRTIRWGSVWGSVSECLESFLPTVWRQAGSASVYLPCPIAVVKFPPPRVSPCPLVCAAGTFGVRERQLPPFLYFAALQCAPYCRAESF